MTLFEALGPCTTATLMCKYLVITVELDNSYDLPLWAVSLQHYGFKRPFSRAHYQTIEAIIEDVKSISGFVATGWFN